MTLAFSDPLRLGPLRVHRTTRDLVAGVVLGALEQAGPPMALSFCNAHMAEIALRDREYAKALGLFTIVNDGIGVEIAARILEGRGFPQNLNGTDFTPYLLGRLVHPTRVFLLGAVPGVAEATGRLFAERFPQVVIAGAQHGYFDPAEEQAIVEQIAAARADLLLVALGNPMQELFIARNMNRLGVRVMLGVGALFDFTTGKVVRAPRWVQHLKLEWLFRLGQEPRRLLRRYTIETGSFLIAVFFLRASSG
jgi:beta-1,4-glucosyltransferase